MFVVKRGEYFRKYNIFEVDFDSGVCISMGCIHKKRIHDFPPKFYSSNLNICAKITENGTTWPPLSWDMPYWKIRTLPPSLIQAWENINSHSSFRWQQKSMDRQTDLSCRVDQLFLFFVFVCFVLFLFFFTFFCFFYFFQETRMTIKYHGVLKKP